MLSLLLKDFIMMCIDTQQRCKQITNHWPAYGWNSWSPQPRPKVGENKKISSQFLLRGTPRRFYENWRYLTLPYRRHYCRLTYASGSERMAWSKERLPSTSCKLLDVREGVSAKNGLRLEGHRLIVPAKLRNRVHRTIHECHFRFEKMELRAQEAVFGSCCI